MKLNVQAARDVVLFVCGLAGVFYETIVGGTEHPTLLIVFAGMLGLPLFLRGDESRATPPPRPADPPVDPTPTPVAARPDRSTP